MSSKENYNDESNLIIKLPGFSENKPIQNRNFNNLIKIKIEDVEMRNKYKNDLI